MAQGKITVEVKISDLVEFKNPLSAIKKLGSPYGGGICFCDMKFNNPIIKDHSAGCIALNKVLKEFKEK